MEQDNSSIRNLLSSLDEHSLKGEHSLKNEILLKLNRKLVEATERQTGSTPHPSGHMRGLMEAIKIVKEVCG
ncbi:hypothetical protein LC76P1_00092 [Lysinibacillus phage LC76P1]|nr:hypothetical protein LC76P1_00092 [Lysinibacillus phage LC76P1]